MSGSTTPTATEAPVPLPLPLLDERDVEPRTPMKRLGSTRKLAAFNNIRMQLAEHTRVLEARAEATAGVAGELHEYCRRRADLEHEYARALDKLARAAHQRHEGQRHKRENWPLTGAFACWQAALDNTRALSRDHAALADLYGGPLAARLQRAADDVLRLHRKCRDIVTERHEEVGAALAEAWGAGKAHAAAAAEWRAAALKLRHAHDQRQRLAAADPPRHKKLKALDKDLEKRRARHSEARVRALRARADYVLSLEAANATLQRYYLDDIADIILCTEVGFEAVVGRTVRTASAAESARAAAAGAAAAAVRAAADALDALTDRRRLLDAHAAAFAPPRPLPYRGAQPDKQDAEMREVVGEAAEERDAGAEHARADLAQRLVQLEGAARRLRAECREHAKTLDAAEAELVRQMEGSDASWDVSELFGAGAVGSPPTLAADEPDAPRRDQEDYYLAKFRSYVSCAGRLARLESKAAAVRGRLLGEATDEALPSPAPPTPPTPPRRAAARLRRGQFAAPLDHRLPVVLTSCVRVIATYGLKHQGVFRVSGSQVEMQALRASFERGEDPLARVRDASDINSVCGLLKLYLREVRPPLLPPQLQDRLLRIAALPDRDEFVRRLRDTLAALPLPALIVLRYLFAFLAHLTEYSEHNMMDAWNLAICVGPTLLAAWGEGGAQVTAQNLVNELVKRTILHHRDVFPQDVAPYALYTRFNEADAEQEARDDAQEEDVGGAGDGAGTGDRQGQGQGQGQGHDEHDARDDLSLYDDDDEEQSDEADTGDWSERDSVDRHRACDERRRGSVQTQASGCPSPAPAPVPAAITPVTTTVTTGTTGGTLPAPVVAATRCRRLAESTPDLVLDLPARPSTAVTDIAHTPTPTPATVDAPPPADSADTFVHNRDTLKKKPHHKQSRSEGCADTAAEGGVEGVDGAGGTGDAGVVGGSPVPARNTARVAAKFAELTLTGGSLKPALAAKPALLRRPTPHPHAHTHAHTHTHTPSPRVPPPASPTPHTLPTSDTPPSTL